MLPLLPDTWEDWCNQIGFYAEKPIEFFGHGRRWRVIENKLQVGNSDFDRWANSVGREVELPLDSSELQERITFCLAPK